MFRLILTISFYLISYEAMALNFSLLAGYGSKKIVAKNGVGGSGTFLSKPSFNQYGGRISFQSSRNWNYFLQYKNKNYTFNDKEEFLEDGNKVNLTEGSIGFDWIPFRYSKLTFSLLQNDELFLKIDNGLAELQAEQLNLFEVGWGQYLYSSNRIGLGLLINYSPNASGDEIDQRTSTGYGTFFRLNTKGWGVVTFSYHSVQIQKNYADLELEDSDKTTEIKWTF